jgi:hypothetical protein
MDSASHGEHDHEPAESFPRGATAELVAKSIAGGDRYWRVQVLLVAFGVSALMLGLHQPPLFDSKVPEIWSTVRGEWTGSNLASAIGARAMASITGVQAQQAWHLLSAVGMAAVTAILLVRARRRAPSASAAIVATLLTVAMPVAWIAGTTAGASSSAILGACLLYSALDAPRASGWRRRATLAWLAAALLHAWNVLLWPAYAWALTRERSSRVGVALGALAAWIMVVLGAWSLEHGPEHLPEFILRSWRALLAGGSGGLGPLLAWCVAWIPWLWTGALGLILLVLAWYRRTERRARGWTLLFAGVPLVVLGLGGLVTYDVPYHWLVPMALSGFVQVPEILAWMLLGLAVPGALVASTGILSLPTREWNDRLVLQLDATDLVVTCVREHAEILEKRFGLDVVDLSSVVDYRGEPSAPLGGEVAASIWSSAEKRAATARSRGRDVVIDVIRRDSSGAWLRPSALPFQRLRSQGAVDLDR